MAKKLTRRSAKPLHEGANPSGASKFFLNFICGRMVDARVFKYGLVFRFVIKYQL